MSSTPGTGASEKTERLEERVRELERKLRLARLHRSAAVAANEADTVEDALRIALDWICRSTDWPVGHAFLRDDHGRFRPTGSWHVADPEGYRVFQRVTREARFAPGEGLVGRVGESGHPEWVRDVRSDPTFLRGVRAPIEVRAALAVPLAHGDRVLGVFELFSDEPRDPDPDLLEILPDVGKQLALVVERARTEHELRISERKFSGIVSLSADAIISVDAEQRIVQFNEGASEIFGYEPNEVVGRPLDVLIPERFRADHRGRVEEFGGSGVSARRMGERQEVFGRRKSGEEFPAEASISKLEVDGRPIYSVVLRDISDRKASDQALERHARELERSNRELEQFAFVASHDLHEPLRKIRSFGDRLVELYADELDDRGRDYLERMHGAAGRMASLIQDLLAFSRVTTRGAGFEPVDLVEAAREAVSDLERRIEETGGEVLVGALPTVDADRTQMRQLFQNLIGNALKYHREGAPPRVEVDGRVVGGRDGPPAAKERPRVEVRVRDNGIGFDEKHAERIFGIFERLHGRSAYEGTGVGLAICRKIVERHGGTLTATSVPGEGATFIATLPATRDVAAPRSGPK